MVEGGDEAYEVHIQCLTKQPGLNEVDPAFAAFTLAYEGLRCTKSSCEFLLGNPLFYANLSQLTKECQVRF